MRGVAAQRFGSRIRVRTVLLAVSALVLLLLVAPPAKAAPGDVDISARGTVVASDGTSVQFSAANACNPASSSRPFIVQWGANRFTKASVTQSACFHDSDVGFGGPAGFNTQTGQAVGLLNGSSATITWTFVDGGFGASLDDKVEFTITGLSTEPVVEVDTQTPDQLSGAPGGVWVFTSLLAADQASLTLKKSGPLAVLQGQTFDFTIEITNVGKAAAGKVTLTDTLPTEGTFVSSNPAAAPAAGKLVIDLGALPAGATKTVTVRWKAPAKDVTLTNDAYAEVQNGSTTPTATARVAVGLETTTDQGIGVRAAGTALRNRATGTITFSTGPGQITNLPKGAKVVRAVLVWTVLIRNALPAGADTIKFENTVVNPVSSQKSGDLCWYTRRDMTEVDTETIGFVGDVTSLVKPGGNGQYTVSGFPGQVPNPLDADPRPISFPTTDGATLFLFFKAPGILSRVHSNFVYDSNVGKEVKRSFTGIQSGGQAARVWIAAADGQSSNERTRFAGANNNDQDGLWTGTMDPIVPPPLALGSLWDTLRNFNVAPQLPKGQATLDVILRQQSMPTLPDCVGIAGVALSVIP